MLSVEVLFTLIDKYTFRVIIYILFFTQTDATNINDHCKIYFNQWILFLIVEIEVFVDISIYYFNKAHSPHGLSGDHWQQTL